MESAIKYSRTTFYNTGEMFFRTIQDVKTFLVFYPEYVQFKLLLDEFVRKKALNYDFFVNEKQRVVIDIEFRGFNFLDEFERDERSQTFVRFVRLLGWDFVQYEYRYRTKRNKDYAYTSLKI